MAEHNKWEEHESDMLALVEKALAKAAQQLQLMVKALAEMTEHCQSAQLALAEAGARHKWVMELNKGMKDEKALRETLLMKQVAPANTAVHDECYEMLCELLRMR